MEVAATTAARHELSVTVERPDGARSEIGLLDGFARIGRDRRAEVALDDPAVSPCHAYLQATPEGVYCAGLAAGVASAWLPSNTALEIAGFRIHAVSAAKGEAFANPPDLQAKHSASAPLPQVRVYSNKGGGSFTDFTLNRRLTLLGRQSPAVWRIKHPTISRLHCVFVWEAGELWLIDLFSSNGTRVAGQRFDAGLLQPGDEFALGQVKFCFLGSSMVQLFETPAALSDTRTRSSADTKWSGFDPSQPVLFEASRQPVINELTAESESPPPWLELRQAFGALEQRLSTTVAEDQRQFQLALENLQLLSSKVAQVETTAAALANEAAERRSQEQQGVHVFADKMAHFEERFGSWSREIDRIGELAGNIAQLQQSLNEIKTAPTPEPAVSAERASGGADAAALESRLNTQLAGIVGNIEGVQRELGRFLAEMAELRTDHAGLQSELRTLLDDLLPRLETGFAALEQRFEQDLAALAKQSQRERGELDRRWGEWQKSSAEKQGEVERRWQRKLGRLRQQFKTQQKQLVRLEADCLGQLTEARQQTALVRQETRALSDSLAEIKDRLAQKAAAPEQAADAPEGADETSAAPFLHGQLVELIQKWEQRDADSDRKLAAFVAATDERLAEMEGTMTARLADFRARQQQLFSEFALVQSRSAQNVFLPEPPQAAAQVPAIPAQLPPPPQHALESPRANQALDADEAGGVAEVPEWLANDEMTQRLLGFRAKRLHSARRRRLLWSLAAAGAVLVMLVAASALRFWTQFQPAKDDVRAAVQEDRP